jgi:hypothetical protein
MKKPRTTREEVINCSLSDRSVEGFLALIAEPGLVVVLGLTAAIVVLDEAATECAEVLVRRVILDLHATIDLEVSENVVDLDHWFWPP